MATDETNSKLNENDAIQEDIWLIRPCEVYDDEYSDCRTIKARFNQYFIHGKSIDCSQWKRDSDNCYKWTDNKDTKAATELINSEKIRRKERLQAHYGNKVWEKRNGPPEDWNKPLPEYLQKEYEYTYLNIKAKEMRGEPTGVISDELPSCVIM